MTTCTDVNLEESDVAVRAEYVYRVLTDFLDLLSDEDREFLARYWGGLQQIPEDLFLQGYQADLSKNIFSVPVFRRSKWNEIVLSHEAEPAVIRSTITGSSYDTSIATGDNTITVEVDSNPVTVTFTDTNSNSLENVILEINNQVTATFPGIIGGIASSENDRIILTSFDSGSTAKLKISDTDGNIELGFFAGTTANGSGVSTRAEPGQLIGSNAGPIYDTSIANGTNTLTISLNGEASKTVTFSDDATSTIVAVIASINEVFPGLATISSDNKVVLTSDTTGILSSVLIPTGGGNSALGFSDGDLSTGTGVKIDNPIPERSVSYDIRVGTSDENLELVPISDPAVVSIPALRSRIDGPTLVFGQGTSPHKGTDETETNLGTNIDPNAELVSDAYIIQNGRIHLSKSVDSKIRNSCLNVLWAEDVYRNDTYLKDNFGFPIQFERENSIEYKNVLQGLHHAYWTGPNIRNTEVGLNLLFGLPTAPISGRIESISSLSSPEVIGTEASDVFDIRDENRTFAFSIDGVFVFAIFDPSNSVPDTGPSPSHENYPASLIRDDINAAAAAASVPFPNPADLVQPSPGVFQIRLQGLNSVRIDTITGNAAIGFLPGLVDFGENEIVIDNQSFIISTEFPITKKAGDVVERLDPLTDGVEVLHYITDPIWWEVFGLASLDSNFSIADGFTQDDLKLINDILKFHVFGLKIVPDAFSRLGNIEIGVVSKFINDIKPMTKNFLFLIPFILLDVFSVTDDPSLDGFPDVSKGITLTFPTSLEVSNWNQIGTAENAGIDPSSTSFTNANSGITRSNFVDGSFGGDTSGFELDDEAIFLTNGGTINVLDASVSGSPPQSYIPGEFISQQAGPYDTTSFSGINMRFNGNAVSVTTGNGSTEIPVGTEITASQVANAITNQIKATFPSENSNALSTIDGKIVFRANRFDGVDPVFELLLAHPEIGITSPPGTITGNAASLVKTVAF